MKIKERYRITTRERFDSGYNETMRIVEAYDPFEALDVVRDGQIQLKSDVTSIEVELV